MTQINRYPDRTAAAAPAPDLAVGGHWSALIASYLGWTLDAFDYFLVVFCLTAIGRAFSPGRISRDLPGSASA
jgi:hypothetical protein